MNITWTSSGAGPRTLALLLLAALTCLLPVSLVPAAATSSPAPEETASAPQTPDPGAPAGEVVVSLTDISPAVLMPGQDLVVRGTVTNGGATALAVPELRLRAQQSAPISRSLLERWLDPTSLSATTLLHAERLEEPVDPGDSAAFALTVPAGTMPFALSYAAWGPRGIELTVHDADSDAATGDVPAARSFLLWWPDIEVETMPLAVLAAASPTGTERAAAQANRTRLDTAAAPRLEPLLAALDRPDVDIAVDPSLLLDAPSVVDLTAGDPATEDATEEPDEPTAPKSALRATLTDLADAPGRTLHALLWADADVPALVHAGREDLVDAAAAARDDALERAGLDASTGLAWPVAQAPDAATLTALGDTDAVVLPGSALTTTTRLTYTPSARADIVLDGTTLPAALTDERLSGLLTGELVPVNPAAEQAFVELDALTARQYLLAETAVVTRERPADRRDLLLTVPRDFDGDPDRLADQLTALAGAPWIERVGLEEMFGRDAPDLERETLPATVVEDGEVDGGELARVTAVLEQTTAFAGVLEEPQALVEPVRTSLLEITSAAWRALPDTRRDLVTAAEEASQARRGLVAARPGSTLNLINDEAHIPVAVTNEMSRPATVVVRLAPRDPRLVADEDVTLEIPAQQSATAQVPVHAVGSGDVVVDVVLASPDGTPIDEPTEMQVRVRADWETVGTAVVAGLLVLMLVVGLVRTVRRARRRSAAGTEEETP